MSRQQPIRAENDRAAALRASEEARTAKFREHAAQDNQQPTVCGSCGARVSAQRAEGEGLPCGH